MVTGQSLILWSPPHLSGESWIKVFFYIKWMIIVDAIVLHLTNTVVTFGSNGSITTAAFVRAYNVWGKIQMTGSL